ncbi:hypothetical protein AB0L00_38475 [Actinoallomurus sp. NPDC052308]|uniref:hypothetical protein n=1 Tax=Actinoallomurus sp. NPDC052308 TaxID=3155530 RepID=UPI0034246B52
MLVEVGVRADIRRSKQTPDGRSKYLAIVKSGQGWTGAVAYIHRARVDFRLQHEDVADQGPRVERKRVDDPAGEFHVALRRQTLQDVDTAVELTRRATAKVG